MMVLMQMDRRLLTQVSTTHKFTKTTSAAKAVTVNTGLDLIADKANFFTAVQTPDSITAKA